MFFWGVQGHAPWKILKIRYCEIQFYTIFWSESHANTYLATWILLTILRLLAKLTKHIFRGEYSQDVLHKLVLIVMVDVAVSCKSVNLSVSLWVSLPGWHLTSFLLGEAWPSVGKCKSSQILHQTISNWSSRITSMKEVLNSSLIWDINSRTAMLQFYSKGACYSVFVFYYQ